MRIQTPKIFDRLFHKRPPDLDVLNIIEKESAQQLADQGLRLERIDSPGYTDMKFIPVVDTAHGGYHPHEFFAAVYDPKLNGGVMFWFRTRPNVFFKNLRHAVWLLRKGKDECPNS